MKDPMNELERAFAVALRGPHGNPELFRQLLAADLTVLMPYHPEMDGELELHNGDTITFTAWQNPQGEFIPIFTSADRAAQAMKNLGSGDTKYCAAELKGEVLFKVLLGHGKRVAINPAAGTGELILDLNAIRLLADGSILHPIGEGESEEGTVQIVDPADYPTDFLQPLFQFLRGRPEVRAAWLFEKPQPEGKYYVFVLLVAGGDAVAVEQDFAVVGSGVTPHKYEFGVTVLDAAEPAQVAEISKFQPFFAAPDYCGPEPR